MSSVDDERQLLFSVKDDLRELVPHFVALQFDELLQMEHSLKAGDLREVSRLGHNLKGAAANFGLEPLCRLGTVIQDVSMLGMTDALEPLVQKYRTYLTELKDQII